MRGAYVCEAGQEHTVRIRAQRWRVEGCRGLGRGLEGVHTHVPCVCHNPLPRDESRGEWAVLGQLHLGRSSVGRQPSHKMTPHLPACV